MRQGRNTLKILSTYCSNTCQFVFQFNPNFNKCLFLNNSIMKPLIFFFSSILLGSYFGAIFSFYWVGQKILFDFFHQFSSVQSLCCVWLFATPWTAAHQASLSITNSQSLFKLMSIEPVMPPNHLILCCPHLLLSSIFPSIREFQMSQLFTSGGQSVGLSALTSVLPMNIQDWFPLG